MAEYICRKVTHEYPGPHGSTIVETEYLPVGGEVVRCRDCIHFRPENQDMHTPPKCTGVLAFIEPGPDGFCKWGRRKSDD